MFGLGMPEIFLILAIALIVIGPKKLPDLAKTLGRAMGEFKRSAQDFKKSIDIDTTLKDMDPPASDLKDVIREVNKEKQEVVKPVDPIKPGESTEDKTDQDKTMDTASETSFTEPGSTETSSTEPGSTLPKDPEKKNE
jgi:Tat protein translocase TatB subunit